MIGCVREFIGNATMSFKINNKQLLKRHNQIQKRVEQLFKIEFDSKTVYGDNDKCTKTKIKIYNGSTITNCQGKKSAKTKIWCLGYAKVYQY